MAVTKDTHRCFVTCIRCRTSVLIRWDSFLQKFLPVFCTRTEAHANSVAMGGVWGFLGVLVQEEHNLGHVVQLWCGADLEHTLLPHSLLWILKAGVGIIWCMHAAPPIPTVNTAPTVLPIHPQVRLHIQYSILSFQSDVKVHMFMLYSLALAHVSCRYNQLTAYTLSQQGYHFGDGILPNPK